MNALIAGPLREAIAELALQVKRIADAVGPIPSEPPPLVYRPETIEVLARLDTIRAGLLGVDQPDELAAQLALAKVEGIEIAIGLLGGKLPKDRKVAPKVTITVQDGVPLELPREAPKKIRRGAWVVTDPGSSSKPARLERLPSSAHDRVLHALARREPLSRTGLAILSRLSVRSGSFAAALANLRANGLIVDWGNGLIGLSAQGRHVAPLLELPAAAELLEHWGAVLGPKGGELLSALLEEHPDAVARDALAARVGSSARSGSFAALLAHARRLGLVEGLRASDELVHALEGKPGDPVPRGS